MTRIGRTAALSLVSSALLLGSSVQATASESLADDGWVAASSTDSSANTTDAPSRSGAARDGRRICDRKPPGRTKDLYSYSQGVPPGQLYSVAGWRTAYRNCSKHRVRVRVDIAFGEDTRCKTFYPHEKRRWRYERKWPTGLQPDTHPRSIVSC